MIALGLGSLYGALGNVKIELAINIEITKGEAVPIRAVGAVRLDAASCTNVGERSAAII